MISGVVEINLKLVNGIFKGVSHKNEGNFKNTGKVWRNAEIRTHPRKNSQEHKHELAPIKI